ncbi:MAG TPA: hypothetical protein VGN23_05755 [Verrucomicrobiae bacterium]|jgi:hypothetical protein
MKTSSQIDQVEEPEQNFFLTVCERLRKLRPNLPSFEDAMKNVPDELRQQKENRLHYLRILLDETGLWEKYLGELKAILGNLPVIEKKEDVYSFGHLHDHCLAANNALNATGH